MTAFKRLSREEINLAVSIIDRHMVEVVASAETQQAWRALRTELRIARRQSSQLLPNMATAAQHLEQAQSHSARAMEALHGAATVSTEPDSIPPPPGKPEE